MNAPVFADIRRIIREELRALRLAELGVVQEIHPHADAGDDDNHACTVRLRDTGLVLARVPVATPRKGLAAIPDVGDLVLVQFVGGEANAPIIIGSLYNDADRPPPNAEGEVVLVLPVDAAEGEGVQVKLASAGESSATLTLGSSLKIALKDDDPVVEIDVGDGSATLKIESDGTLTITSGRAINIEGGEISLKGTTIKAEADGEITLKGAIINLN
ncbi:MAG TPA: phage baseplate assembly protein V [Paracoccaceae bacterium]|nr:phage baseplate assembly protein V [Paracoccaceae bacterium]